MFVFKLPSLSVRHLSSQPSSKFHSPSAHAIASSASESRTSASFQPLARRAMLARSTIQPRQKVDPRAIAGGVIGALLLTVLFVGLFVYYIRRRNTASQSKQKRSNTDASTKVLVSAPAPLEDGASEGAPVAITNHTSSPEAPLTDTSVPQYTVFDMSPPSSPPNANSSTQTDAVARNAATPYNSPLDLDLSQRRGIGFSESGHSVSPRLTVARITARLEEREYAQNASLD